MNSTTTCTFGAPKITDNPTVLNGFTTSQNPTANNQNFNWSTSTCVTTNVEQSFSISTTSLTFTNSTSSQNFEVVGTVTMLFAIGMSVAIIMAVIVKKLT